MILWEINFWLNPGSFLLDVPYRYYASLLPGMLTNDELMLLIVHLMTHLLWKVTKVNYIMVTPVSPKQKVDICLFKCPNTKYNCSHICSSAHRPKQMLSRVGYLFLPRDEDRQRQKDWLTLVDGVWYFYILSNTHTGWQTPTGKHPLLLIWGGSMNSSFYQNKDNENTSTLDCIERHKVRGTPLPLPPHKQRVRKTTQLPPFSQSGNS